MNETNPLLHRSYEIPFDSIRAEHVVPAIESLIRSARSQLDEILDRCNTSSYEDSLGALDDATTDLDWASTVVSHLESVRTSADWRAAYQEIQPLLSRFWTSVTLDERIWKLACELEAASTELNRFQARHLKRTVDDLRRQGAELEDAKKERIAEINEALSNKTTAFAQNVLDATNAFELIVEDESQLAGLPESTKAAAKEDAATRAKTGWRFTLHAPSIIPVLTYAENRELRRTIWEAFSAAGSKSPYDNRDLIREILKLRNEKARILGYEDFSDLILEDRMAGSGKEADRFVTDLTEKTRRMFDAENEQLEAFAGESGLIDTIKAWDTHFLSERIRKEKFDFDEEDLRPFFPLAKVRDGMFSLFGELFGISIEGSGLPRWHSDVEVYDIIDQSGHMVGSFYLDLFPREDKRSGGWMNPMISGVPPQPHLGVICCNFNKASAGKPALLTHREVETLFHEFGHLLHHCLSEVPLRALSGTRVAWDFVELPSQIMENWCWEPESLAMFSGHYETGEPLPKELLDKLRAARTFRAANGQMRQLGFSTLDLKLHREFDPDSGDDPVRFARDVLVDFTPSPLPEDYGFLGSFRHLFADPVGYAAAYYSYKWAEVLDADAFTRFRDAGVLDAETGREYRSKILSQGNSEEPQTLFRDFMGRDPDPDALLIRLGIAA